MFKKKLILCKDCQRYSEHSGQENCKIPAGFNPITGEEEFVDAVCKQLNHRCDCGNFKRKVDK